MADCPLFSRIPNRTGKEQGRAIASVMNLKTLQSWLLNLEVMNITNLKEIMIIADQCSSYPWKSWNSSQLELVSFSECHKLSFDPKATAAYLSC